jgi:Mg-chelatase subunit ChlD
MRRNYARKLAAAFTAAVTALSLMSVPALAATQTTWQVSKSKTATALDANDRTTVTLSLPSAEEKLTSDIVFVLDKSSCAPATAAEAETLLNNLKNAIASSKATVKISVVAFDGTDHLLYPLTNYTGTNAQISAIKSLMSVNSIPAAEHVGGTNMQAGLDKAHEVLNADTSVQSSRKYMVLVSDGLTRLFTGKDGQVKDIYYQYAYGKGVDDDITPKQAVYFGMIDEWDLARNGPSSSSANYQLPFGDWNTYFSKVAAWVKADGDTYALNYAKYGNDPTNMVKDANGNITDSSFSYIAHKDSANHAMSVDRAVYEAYNSYKSMVDSGYRCYAVRVADYGFSKAFMGALNNLSGNTSDVSFTSIQNGILYLLASGTVTDEIGDHFDLVTAAGTCPFTLTLNGDALTSVQDTGNANVWNFGSQLADGNYQYSVEYKPASGSTKEQFVWSINVPVKNTVPIQLSYKEQLVNKETADGTYTVNTNGNTVLAYQDSNGSKGVPENFVSPAVSYSVASIPDEPVPLGPTPTPAAPVPSSGGSGTVTIDDDAVPLSGSPTSNSSTGDRGNAALIALLLVSGAAALGSTIYSHRKNHAE